MNGRSAKPHASRKRALLVSYYFPPAREVGAQRPARLARLLPEFGYDVDVVCSAPVDIPSESLERLPHGGHVYRVPPTFVLGRDPEQIPPREHPGRWISWKARAHVESFLLTHEWSWKWGVAAVRHISRQARKRSYDVVILDAPPRPAVAPFARWARTCGFPIVLDLRDVWAMEDETLPPWSYLVPATRRKAWTLKLRDEVVGGSKHVVLTSPEMADLMAGRFPNLPRESFSAIPNAYSDVDDRPVGLVGSGTPEHPFRIVYTGSLAYGRALQAAALIGAIADVRREGGPIIELVIAGTLADRVLAAAETEGVTGQLRVHDWMSRDQAIDLQRGAGALLLLQPDEHIGVSVAIPAKLFEYMARRRMVLALAGGATARIVREHGLGVVGGSDDRRALAIALRELVERAKASPFLPVPPSEFSAEATVGEFAAVLDRVSNAER